MKKKQLLKFIWMFFYLFIFSMLLWNSFGYLDNDLGWHLKVGEEFVTKHEIPYNEHFNYTLEGEKWIDHEWLIDVFSFIVNKNYKILLWLIPLFCFWANVHGGFLIGLALLGFFAMIKFLENLIEKYNVISKIKMEFKNKLDLKSIYIFSFFALFSFLATFINPYGWRLYEFLFGYKNSYYLTHIVEWIPFYFLPVKYYQLLYSAIVLSLVIVFLYLSLKKIEKKYFLKLDLWQLALAVLFVFLALKSRRHFPLLFIASMPFIIIFYIEHIAAHYQNNKKPTQLILFSKIFLVLVLVLASFKMVVNTQFNNNPFNSAFYCSNSFPCEAVKFIKENPELMQKKLFNEYDWGGFLIWTMPEMKLFIDGRLPQFSFNEHTFLEEYHEFFEEDKTSFKLEQYGIDLALIKERQPIKLNWIEKHFFLLNEEDINSKVDYLKKYLDESSLWTIIYSDNFSHLYEKQNN